MFSAPKNGCEPRFAISRNAVPLLFAGVLGTQDQQVGGELHQSGGVPRRQVDIDDGAIGGQLGIDGEVHLARDPFVTVRGRSTRSATSTRVTAA